MDSETFSYVLKGQIKRTESILGDKAREYATDDDRLHNFKQAAHLQGETPIEALAGFMAKHTVSIYDMCRETGQGLSYPVELWSEKITDHINYLILLKALVEESAATTMPMPLQWKENADA